MCCRRVPQSFYFWGEETLPRRKIWASSISACPFFYNKMKKILLTFLLLLSIYNLSYAQNQNSNLCFGFNAGIHFDNLNNPTAFTSAVNSRGSCASISDSIGNLLFYVANDTIALYHDSACKVYNANNQLMQNGDGLIGLGWYQEFTIIPYPDSFNLYYVFQIGIT